MYWTLPLTCLVSSVTVSETLKASLAHGVVAQGGSELYLHTSHLLLWPQPSLGSFLGCLQLWKSGMVVSGDTELV